MKMYIQPISKEEIANYLAIPDLTEDEDHAVGLLYQKIKKAITESNPQSKVMIYKGEKLVSVKEITIVY